MEYYVHNYCTHLVSNPLWPLYSSLCYKFLKEYCLPDITQLWSKGCAISAYMVFVSIYGHLIKETNAALLT